MKRSGLILLALAGLLGALAGPRPAAAQRERCFAETGQCVSGRFLEYWEQNGGLPVFGFPITPVTEVANRETGQSHPTQWFERNRFELHAENAKPFDVLLGRLGDDRLLQLHRDWESAPRESGPRDGCRWFADTGFNVCDQEPGRGFKSTWEGRGLQDPKLDGFGRSLALFGNPISPAREETNASGDKVLTQWFERARLEWHPANRPEFRVLLGLLGGELRAKPRFVTLWDGSGADDGGLFLPEGLALDGKGRVYVVDYGNERVVVYNERGRFLDAWGETELVGPEQIAIGPDGSIYVADEGSYRIVKFSPDGAVVGGWGGETLRGEEGKFFLIGGIAVDAAGDVYVTDSRRIQKFTANGELLAVWDGDHSEIPDYYNPKGIVIAPHGDIYVTDTSKDGVRRLDANGKLLLSWGNDSSDDGDDPGEFIVPGHVTLDRDGNVYVTDSRRVQKFTPDGQVLEVWGSETDDSFSEEDGQFVGTSGIAVTPAGLIYVADYYHNRIQVLKGK
ncbi:MAG TPA: NHL repeat-containing protein [Herpetosiphonaceae bacterium]